MKPMILKTLYVTNIALFGAVIANPFLGVAAFVALLLDIKKAA
jgi:hypothetical protein